MQFRGSAIDDKDSWWERERERRVKFELSTWFDDVDDDDDDVYRNLDLPKRARTKMPIIDVHLCWQMYGKLPLMAPMKISECFSVPVP